MSKDTATMWSSFFGQNARNRLRHDTLSFLATVPLFSSLSKRELNTINSIAHHRTYQEEEFVFRKGQPGAAMFIVRSGAINIIDHDEGNQANVLTTLDDHSFFGELALLDDSPRSASAVAAKTTETFAFFRTDLDRLLTAFPQIGLKVYRSLSMIIGNRLKDTNEQLLSK
ncbi:MAG: cyclic nucleotide-binding domain-containing protein [Thermodesulfobacteriota bacterium]